MDIPYHFPPTDRTRTSSGAQATHDEDDHISYVSDDDWMTSGLALSNANAVANGDVGDQSTHPGLQTALLTAPSSMFVTAQPYGFSPYPDASPFVAAPLSMFVTAQPYGLSPYPDAPATFSAIDRHVAHTISQHGVDPGTKTIQAIPATVPLGGQDPEPDVPDRQVVNAATDVGEHRLRSDENQGHEDHRQDLLPGVKGMFRLLDLYSEQGSGGLGERPGI